MCQTLTKYHRSTETFIFDVRAIQYKISTKVRTYIAFVNNYNNSNFWTKKKNRNNNKDVEAFIYKIKIANEWTIRINTKNNKNIT